MRDRALPPGYPHRPFSLQLRRDRLHLTARRQRCNQGWSSFTDVSIIRVRPILWRAILARWFIQEPSTHKGLRRQVPVRNAACQREMTIFHYEWTSSRFPHLSLITQQRRSSEVRAEFEASPWNTRGIAGQSFHGTSLVLKVRGSQVAGKPGDPVALREASAAEQLPCLAHTLKAPSVQRVSKKAETSPPAISGDRLG